MTTKSTMSLTKKTKGALCLLACSLFCLTAPSQTVPTVTSSTSTGLAHSNPSSMGNLAASGLTTSGDWLVQDFANGALYEFPANGGSMITLLAAGSLGGYQDPGFAIDSNNTLYLEGNWANCVLSFAYDPTTKTWPGLSAVNTAVSPNNATQSCPGQYVIIGGNYPYQYWPADLNARYVQPKGMVTDHNNNLIIGTYDSGDSWIGVFPITTSNGVGTAGPIQVLLQHASGYTMSVAVDNWGNTYFTENQGANSDFPHPLPGVLMIPAGTTDLQTDTGLTRVDPTNLTDVTAVTADPEGNLYVSDGIKGVVMIPAATSATTLPQTSKAVLVSADAAQGNVSIDWARQILYVPTTTTQSNGQADVAKVRLGKVELGSTAVATATTATPVGFVFNGAASPNSFSIEEDGATADFAVATGGSCSTTTAYAFGGSCTVNVTASPNSAGSVSAKLLMLDSSNNVLASTDVHSVGLGSAVSISPAVESVIGSKFKTPSQVAVDASGNTYVADAGLGEVLMYAKGSSATTTGVSIGTGLTAPTGVAVDGAGDVFIADSGNVTEVPYGPSGLNTAGQLTLRSGLGTKLQLAADGLGNLYVADPDNARVVKLGLAGGTIGGMLSPEIDLTAGFTAPSAVAVDASNNLYVLDSQNLLEVQPDVAPTTVVTGLGAATGLAFDPSGALYATLTGGTERIPNVSGTLTLSSETAFATNVTAPSGIAIDKTGNVYIGDAGAEDLQFVGVNGSVAFGTISAATSEDVSLLNIGNSSLTVTGFTSSDATDFSATGCTSAVAAGGTCDATVGVVLGPGVQGAISSTITVNGNQANAPVAIDATATGGALATTGGVSITVASTATVNSTPITVTVTPATGGAAPTGTVTVTVDGGFTTSATLSGGTATITIPGIPAGSHTFAVTYVGDRTYGSATASTKATVAKGTVTLSVPALPTYVLSTNDGELPYDSSLNGYESYYVVTVNGAAGLPATGTMAFMQGTTAACGVDNLGTPSVGQATFQPGCLAISTNNTSPNEVTVQALTSIVYSGDANYLPATATTTTAGAPLTYNELRQPSVSIAPNPASLALTSGTGSIQLNVSSVLGYGVSTNSAYPGSTPTLGLNNYSLPVGFACQGLPAYSTCTFSGGNYTDINGVLHTDEFVIDTDPTKPVAVTVTIQSNVPLTTASNHVGRSPIAFAVLFGFGLIGLVSRRRFKDARLLALASILTLTGATLGLTSCSGSNFPVESSATTTPAGNYAVSITAQQVGSIVVLGSTGTPVTLYGILNQVSLPYTLNVTVH